MRQPKLLTFAPLAFTLTLACGDDGGDNSSGPTDSDASTSTATETDGSTTTSTTPETGGSTNTSTTPPAGTTGGEACMWSETNNPCQTGLYCNALGCGAGICDPIRGPASDSIPAPVCGCDGVDYWNAWTAASYGMAARSAGQCPQPKTCGGIGGLACPDDQHFCNYLLPSQLECGTTDAAGTCWGMPNSCTTIGFGGTWRACTDDPGGACAYECDAIKRQTTHWSDDGCPQ